MIGVLRSTTRSVKLHQEETLLTPVDGLSGYGDSHSQALQAFHYGYTSIRSRGRININV